MSLTIEDKIFKMLYAVYPAYQDVDVDVREEVNQCIADEVLLYIDVSYDGVPIVTISMHDLTFEYVTKDW